MNQTPNTPAMPAVIANLNVCGSCNAEQPEPFQDENGKWHRAIVHDADCPIATGAVDPGWDLFRASRGGREAGQ